MLARGVFPSRRRFGGLLEKLPVDVVRDKSHEGVAH